jgi:20S proteasome subunit alpha 3
MPVEQIVKSVCNYKQAYTQFGGLRPFGVAFVFAGWDINHGFQLYQSDPSGNYSGWKATVIGERLNVLDDFHFTVTIQSILIFCFLWNKGQNNQAGKSILKTDYKEDATINDNLKLSVKILLKTLDSATPSPERIELSVLKKGPDDKIVHTTLTDAEVGFWLSYCVLLLYSCISILMHLLYCLPFLVMFR